MTRTEWKVMYREFRLDVNSWIRSIVKNDSKAKTNKIWTEGAGAARFDFIHQMRRNDPLTEK